MVIIANGKHSSLRIRQFVAALYLHAPAIGQLINGWHVVG